MFVLAGADSLFEAGVAGITVRLSGMAGAGAVPAGCEEEESALAGDGVAGAAPTDEVEAGVSLSRWISAYRMAMLRRKSTDTLDSTFGSIFIFPSF
ncbi:MAG TPA: hypothetical protein ENK53_02990, partial [Thiotrichales bacterium]|nr:hypothetical protein [Thiotrichales bacterium]